MGFLPHLDYNSVRDGAGVHLSMVSRSLRRSRRTKTLWGIAGVMLLLLFLSRTGLRSIVLPDISELYPTQPVTSFAGGDISPAINHPPPRLNEDGTFASGTTNSHPSFHLIIRGSQKNPGICRTIFSAMVLNYPPPTVLDMDDPTPEEGKPKLGKLDKPLVMHSYLTKSTHMKDDDVILIIDDSETWFQLPPQIMLQRFHDMLIKNDEKLRWRYGSVPVKLTKNADLGSFTSTQRYSQRVIFAADKVCRPNRPYDASCYAVPYSTLPPDIFGPLTDAGTSEDHNRPRWLNSGSLIGLVGDVKRLYERAAEINSIARIPRDEQDVLAQIFGEQEYARELDRRFTRPNWYIRMGELFGIIPRIDISRIFVSLTPGRRYEFAISLDYKSQLFFTMSPHSHYNLEWLNYNNLSQVSSAQLIHRVPRESRLNLPEDISKCENPFNPPHPLTTQIPPPYNSSVDYLPSPENESWFTIPLATDVHSTSVPALLQANIPSSPATQLDPNPDLLHVLWQRMWYHPWSRALLRKYMRASQGPIAAHAAMQGGGTAGWDTRGGSGGVWTGNDEWVDWTTMCKQTEEGVFGDDGFGKWGEELGFDYQAPVYNKFGMKVSGRGPEKLKDKEREDREKKEKEEKKEGQK
ncbi:hypothetical protein AJ78_06872 [Emergomyces pasteurianus Ep9510]|uniref:Uncharacterized protein n=1 Tax=Emergomyces pasteurianus Ep9510 TaxID=1447872 RepID=A0A1J9P7D2_9EURO|nr:hypothetical protein AJ78_06872 [Emergomyces pasteurianus Ep9510]